MLLKIRVIATESCSWKCQKKERRMEEKKSCSWVDFYEWKLNTHTHTHLALFPEEVSGEQTDDCYASVVATCACKCMCVCVSHWWSPDHIVTERMDVVRCSTLSLLILLPSSTSWEQRLMAADVPPVNDRTFWACQRWVVDRVSPAVSPGGRCLRHVLLP